MEENFVKCSDCWRRGVLANEQYNDIVWCNPHPACREMRARIPAGLGCTKGVTTAQINEAISDEMSRLELEARELAGRIAACEDDLARNDNVWGKLQRHKELLELQQKEKGRVDVEHIKTVRVNFMRPPSIDEIHDAVKRATNRFVHDTARSILSGNTDKPLSTHITFCCENCQEPVIVPKDMLKDELRFKCQSCQQENHYDLS